MIVVRKTRETVLNSGDRKAATCCSGPYQEVLKTSKCVCKRRGQVKEKTFSYVSGALVSVGYVGVFSTFNSAPQ